MKAKLKQWRFEVTTSARRVWAAYGGLAELARDAHVYGGGMLAGFGIGLALGTGAGLAFGGFLLLALGIAGPRLARRR
jgi:hypothetical protein